MEALATIAAATLEGEPETAVPPTAVPSDTPAPPPTTTPTVAHLTTPGEPGGVVAFISDSSSQPLAAERRAIADNFNTNHLERPFTSQQMDYQAHLDLTRAEWRAGGSWHYISLSIEGEIPSGQQPAYGVEFDLDLDGRGDVLILGLPQSAQWSTAMVFAYEDTDGDVGGATPRVPNPPPQTGSGYETLIFNQGYSPDPDVVWARLAPSDPTIVEFAFKPLLIQADSAVLWGAWAQQGALEPGWFDYHDHFSLAQAGSPISNSNDYPIKELASVDSTCRWVYGFSPTGSEPGICPVPATPTPTPSRTITPTPSWTPLPPPG
jgi:hypothetical protein